MSNRAQEFRVGIVTLVCAGIASVLATVGTGISLPTSGATYPIEIRTDRAPGVGPNTPVRKDGVVIGRVTSTEFLPQGGVLVRAAIEREAPIYATDSCSIRPTSLFGDAVINFAYAGGPADPQKLDAGAMVDAAALPDPIEALTSLQVDVAPTIDSIGRAAESFETLTSRLNAALGDDFDGERVNTLLDEVSVALRDFQSTMQVISNTMNQVDTLASDPRLQQGLQGIPDLLSDARGTVQKATETLDSFDGVVKSAEANLVNLEGFTEPLGERGPELSEKLISAVENLDTTLADASKFVTAVTDSRGSLNRLLTDPELYEQITLAANKLNWALHHFDERLKELRPILHDVRVITDKVAREPGRVVSGAFNRGPGLK